MQEIILQRSPTSVKPTVNVSQFDDGLQFRIIMYDGATPYTPEAGAIPRIDGIKPDRHGFSYVEAVTRVGNVLTVTTNKQMTCVAGTVPCEIRFVKEDQDIGSLNFDMVVEESPINDDVDISETVLPAIFELATEQMLTAEAYAKGTRGGVPVTPDQEGYEDNSKYYKDLAAASEADAEAAAQAAIDAAEDVEENALKSEGYAKGTQNGTPVVSGEYFENNSKYYSEQAADSADEAEGSADNASDSAAAALLSEQNAKASEDILRFYVEFIVPRFVIANNRLYISVPATGEFLVTNNRLYIKNPS